MHHHDEPGRVPPRPTPGSLPATGRPVRWRGEPRRGSAPPQAASPQPRQQRPGEDRRPYRMAEGGQGLAPGRWTAGQALDRRGVIDLAEPSEQTRRIGADPAGHRAPQLLHDQQHRRAAGGGVRQRWLSTRVEIEGGQSFAQRSSCTRPPPMPAATPSVSMLGCVEHPARPPARAGASPTTPARRPRPGSRAGHRRGWPPPGPPPPWPAAAGTRSPRRATGRPAPRPPEQASHGGVVDPAGLDDPSGEPGRPDRRPRASLPHPWRSGETNTVSSRSTRQLAEGGSTRPGRSLRGFGRGHRQHIRGSPREEYGGSVRPVVAGGGRGGHPRVHGPDPAWIGTEYVDHFVRHR